MYYMFKPSLYPHSTLRPYAKNMTEPWSSRRNKTLSDNGDQIDVLILGSPHFHIRLNYTTTGNG